MRNTIKVFSIILLAVILFSGCSFSNETTRNTKKDIVLTTENIHDYLTFSLHGGGGNSNYNSYLGEIVYKSLEASGNISGISGYEYDDVSITLVFKYEVTPSDDFISETFTTLPKTVNLNIGGNGVVNVSNPFTNSFTKVKCLGYEVVAVSGKVKPI